MILIDTSCWVDFLRKADTQAAAEVGRLVREDLVSIATCEPVAMELLAGSSNARVHAKIEQLVNGLPSLSLDARTDFRTAASIQQAARAQGYVIRNMIDCLIAAVALRAEATILHKDADFEVISSITHLKSVSVR